MIGYSTNSSVFNNAEDTFDRLYKIGYTHVDISFSYMYDNDIFDMCDNEFEKYIDNLKERIEKSKLKVYQCHAPYQIPWVGEDKIVNATIKSIEACGKLGSKYIVIHPVMPFHMICENNKQAMVSKKTNMEFFKMLIPYAQKYNVKIAIENLFPKGGAACSAESLLDYVNTLDSPFVSACLDIGHANVCGYNAVDMIYILKNKLSTIHIHDNWGKECNFDIHHIPFLGNIDWKSVMGALKEVGFCGVYNMENTNFSKHFPKELQDKAESLALDSLKYIVENYGENK